MLVFEVPSLDLRNPPMCPKVPSLTPMVLRRSYKGPKIRHRWGPKAPLRILKVPMRDYKVPSVGAFSSRLHLILTLPHLLGRLRHPRQHPSDGGLTVPWRRSRGFPWLRLYFL